MGDNHPHSRCHGGCTGNLGVHRIAEMARERIMSALNYPVHHSGCVRMKMLFTSEVTILPKAEPIMTPTARSITFPLRVNSLNS